MYCFQRRLMKELIIHMKNVKSNKYFSSCYKNILFNNHQMINLNKCLKFNYNNKICNCTLSKFFCSKSPSDNDNDEKNVDEKNQKLSQSIASRFDTFKDSDAQEILDIDEEILRLQEIPEEEQVYLYQEKKKEKFDHLKRGKSGVFDIHELVGLLRNEKLEDIAVIKIPKYLKYADYLVLANAKSIRHLNAVIGFINKVYKKKKSDKDDFLNFGGDKSKDWKVVDMKNIVLHLFLKETREYYDIETLWTVGQEYDDKTQRPEVDPVIDIMEKHIKYLEDIQTAQ